MSYSAQGRINLGAYERPFSGVGIEYDPLGVKPDRTGIILHEVGYLRDNQDWNFPSVFSPFWRLYYNTKGGHCVLFGDRMVELTPRHMMLIPPDRLFHCLGTNPVPTFWIAFSAAGKLDSRMECPVLLPPRDTELCLIRDLKRLIAADKNWEPTPAIWRNGQALLQVVLSRRELHWQPPMPEPMERLRRYIEEHLDSNLSNMHLARQTGLSVTGFERAFKRLFGTTASRYVSQIRIGESARLLLQSDGTIDEIAERTGFPNRAYFSRVFKNLTGHTPARFRRRHKQGFSSLRQAS